MTYFDEVVSVVDDGESDVHDMTVPGESRFDAGGIVVHNCASGLSSAGPKTRSSRSCW